MAAYQNNQKVEQVGTVDFLTRINSSRAGELKDIAAFNFYGYGSVERMREGMQDVLSGERIETLVNSDYVKSKSFLDAARSVGLDERLITRLTSDYEGIQPALNELDILQIGQAILKDMAGEDGKLDWKREALPFIEENKLGQYGHDLVLVKHTLDHNPQDFTATIGSIHKSELVQKFKLDSIDAKYRDLIVEKPDSPRRPILGGDKPPIDVPKPITGGGVTIKDPKEIVKPGPLVPKGNREFDDSKFFSVPRYYSSKDSKIQKAIQQPGQAIWITDMSRKPYEAIDNLGSTLEDANSKGKTPFVVSYFIKGRDVAEVSAGGRHSAGGAQDQKEWDLYCSTYVRETKNADLVTIIEPDALGHTINEKTLKKYQNVDFEDMPKIKMIRQLVDGIREGNSKNGINPLTGKQYENQVMFDIGNSAWLGAKPEVVAAALVAEGIRDNDLMASNIANFNLLGQEIAYGNSVVKALKDLGIEGIKFSVDTSRNGNGKGQGGIFNPKGVAQGLAPTSDKDKIAEYLLDPSQPRAALEKLVRSSAGPNSQILEILDRSTKSLSVKDEALIKDYLVNYGLDNFYFTAGIKTFAIGDGGSIPAGKFDERYGRMLIDNARN